MLTGWPEFDRTFRTFDLLQRQMDRVLEETDAWPVVSVKPENDGFTVEAALPGVTDGDVEVTIENDTLTLRGKRNADAPEGYEVRHKERATRTFQRKLVLGSKVDAEAISASMKHGILTLKLPKAKEARPRRIAVNAS